jgi:ubiquinone/menaquinone biosynthesis C-methylase UbiE
MWEGWSDEYQEKHGAQLEERHGWGAYGVPESELRVLGDVNGRDVLELGCGAAQWSIRLAKQGARVTGLDLSPRQLAHARRLMKEAGVDFPLIEGSAEEVPLPDDSFDVVFCDHGAFTFADPLRLVPESARLLRPGGLLAFCTTTAFLETAWDYEADGAGERLLNDYFGMHRLEDASEVVFQLPYGEWIRLFRENGFTIEALIELRPPEGGDTAYKEFVRYEWSRRWPSEQIWKVRLA